MKIGRKIAELRREKGWTQEKLAEALGVSTPAVSKWETDSSYPDITLLCPLARALDTNVDTLLQFEKALSEHEAVEKVNEVVAKARDAGHETGERLILELIREYPNSLNLKFYAAAAWDCLRMFFPAADEESKARWQENKRTLLNEVRMAKTNAHWQNAAIQLAGSELAEGHLEEAESLLQELPRESVDATMSWAMLYLDRNQPEQALKTVQKRLYSLVHQVQSCLTMMMDERMLPDAEKALKICETLQQLDRLFECDGGVHDALFMEIYLRLNQTEDAAEALNRYVDAITGKLKPPKALLFEPGVTVSGEHDASIREMRSLLAQALREDEKYSKLLAQPKGQAALKKLEESL